MTSLPIETRIVDRFPLSAGSDIENSGTGTMSRRQATAALLVGTALAAMPGLALSAQEAMTSAGAAPDRWDAADAGAATAPLHAGVRAASAAAADRVRPLVGRVRYQSPERRSHCAVLAAHHGDRRLRRDGRRRMALRPEAACAVPHLAEDIRAQTGRQDFVAAAPLDLVYVAHGERMQDISAGRAPALRVRRYRLHWPERLPVLRVGGACDRLSGSGRLPESSPPRCSWTDRRS